MEISFCDDVDLAARPSSCGSWRPSPGCVGEHARPADGAANPLQLAAGAYGP
ncbi:MAG: hypothetical protein IT379_35420 [Deltaproteobacteria bacterium]|nr:hypothetical protein [Deltaproteobacteria bacterium]